MKVFVLFFKNRSEMKRVFFVDQNNFFSLFFVRFFFNFFLFFFLIFFKNEGQREERR